MAQRSIDELDVLRAELARQRRQKADAIADPNDVQALQALVQIHQAVEALDAVIADIEVGVEPDPKAMIA